jgi:hypothetical protein
MSKAQNSKPYDIENMPRLPFGFYALDLFRV